MSEHSTLIKPPPLDPNKSEIESVLELTQLKDIDPVRLNPFAFFANSDSSRN